MQSFPYDRVDEIIRHVVEHGCNMTVQADAGDTLSVFEDHSDGDKQTIVEQFCKRHPGPYRVYSVESL